MAALPLAGLLALAAWGDRAPDSPAGHAAADAVTVVFSTEQNGYLTPCGCSKPMLGGLPRRAGFLRKLGAVGAEVRVDDGDLTEAMGRQDEMKAETLVEMLGGLDYDAVALGEKDFRLGMPFLRALQERFKGAMLCANAIGPDGNPLFKEITLLRRQAGGKPVRIVIAGLLSEQFTDAVTAAEPGARVEAPAASLERLRGRMMDSDMRILLYHGPMEEAAEIARQFPALAMIVCAHEGDHPVDAKKVGSTVLVCSGQDGKYVGQATLARSQAWKNPSVRYTALGPEFEEDRAILAIQAAYLKRVEAEDLLGKVPQSPTLNGDAYAGTETCAPCHAEAYRIWKASGHAHALQTLETVKHNRDPECVTCHVVGLDRQSGFVSPEKTPGLAHVGCENCHGAAAKHVADPKTPLAKVGAEGCLGCHNPQNSPRFQFDKYWPKIRH